jgi:hypothetical protein
MNTEHLAFTVDSTVPPCRWIASLSDGSTVFENFVPEVRLAWMRLKSYLSNKDISITRLRLQCGMTIHNIPRADAYFIFKKIHRGIINLELTGIGVVDTATSSAQIFWFDSAGVLREEENRSIDMDHAALIFTKKI